MHQVWPFINTDEERRSISFNAEIDEYYGVTELKNVENLEVLSQNNEIMLASKLFVEIH